MKIIWIFHSFIYLTYSCLNTIIFFFFFSQRFVNHANYAYHGDYDFQMLGWLTSHPKNLIYVLFQVSGLKSITSKHLALASQVISFTFAIVPGKL